MWGDQSGFQVPSKALSPAYQRNPTETWTCSCLQEKSVAVSMNNKALRAHIVWLRDGLGATLKTESPTCGRAATGLVLYGSVHRAWHKLCRIGGWILPRNTPYGKTWHSWYNDMKDHTISFTVNLACRSLYKPSCILSSTAKKRLRQCSQFYPSSAAGKPS